MKLYQRLYNIDLSKAHENFMDKLYFLLNKKISPTIKKKIVLLRAYKNLRYLLGLEMKKLNYLELSRKYRLNSI